MNKEEIKPGIVIRNTRTKQIGVPYTGHCYESLQSSFFIIVYQGNDKNPNAIPIVLGAEAEDLERYELKPEDMLTEEHIREVCKPATGEACRYLFKGTFGNECARVLSNPNIKGHIDDLVETGRKKEKGRNCGGRYLPQALERERLLLSNVKTTSRKQFS